ncbi:hypothetical protein FXO38_20701 [Capsicum annuum]|nr:hypothetical protein FXO38_20701 [Capsicum annuum]
MCSLKDGNEVDVFVKHLVDEPIIVDPMFLENISHGNMEESGASFNDRPNFMVDSATIDSSVAPTAAAASSASPSVVSPSVVVRSAAEVDDIDVGPAGSDFAEEEYGNDVHEEVRELRAEKRKFQRRKRNERVSADKAEVPVGEVGPDLGFDDTETGKVSHEGRLGGDEPYFASSDKGSFELDEDGCCGDEKHDMPASEFGQILNYKDKLLRTNSGTSCVVKLGEANEEAPPVPTIFSASSSTPPDFGPSSSIAETTKRGMSSSRGNTTPFKRQAKNGFKVLNPDMSSSKIYSTGQAKVARSVDVTGDIGYTLSTISKVKWNGKSAMSTRKLQELKENKRKKTVESSANHPSQIRVFSQSKML